MPLVNFKFRIPLLGKSTEEAEKLIHEKERSLRPIAVTKPARVLGACWTSDKVSERRPIVHCEECLFRYRGWWKREHYRGDWGWRWRGDCDGCGTPGVSVTFFHAEERFHDVLTMAHGKQTKP